ncbi:hypothetical protein CLOP_g16103, partial [Closterium sp. NIES-67]
MLASLPYRLTAGQMQAAREIISDMNRPVPMARLLQGDVGCGKTVVALLACMEAVAQGYQVAVMAPTQFLAQQHYARFEQLLEALPCSPTDCLFVDRDGETGQGRAAGHQGGSNLYRDRHARAHRQGHFFPPPGAGNSGRAAPVRSQPAGQAAGE